MGVEGRPPFGTVVTHGFVLDENGKKMSKSLGNIVDPMVLVEGGKDLRKDPAYGSDILRLWAGSTEYVQDVHMGKTVMCKLRILGRGEERGGGGGGALP